MQMLANNYRAVNIHILVSILVVLVYAILGNGTYVLTLIVAIIISSFSYIILGFLFLKPVPKCSYLSTLSVFIILQLIVLYCSGGSRDVYLFYLLFNIGYAELFDKIFNGSNYNFFISATIPSLFMYFGLLLKMLLSDDKNSLQV